jgi:hypothetical protein
MAAGHYFIQRVRQLSEYLKMLLLAVALASAPSAHAGWLKIESPNFIVYSAAREGITRNYIRELEAFYFIGDQTYRGIADTVLPHEQKITLYYMSAILQFQVIKPQFTPYGFMPYFSCRDGMQYVYTVDNNLSVSTNQTYRFAHINAHLQNKYNASNMPKWVSTGMFWYLMTTETRENALVVGAIPENIMTYEGGDITSAPFRMPFPDVISGTYSQPKKKGALKGQSWLMTHYFMTDSQRQKQLQAYLQLYYGGMPSLDAFKQATKLDPTFFDKLIVYEVARPSDGLQLQAFAR